LSFARSSDDVLMQARSKRPGLIIFDLNATRLDPIGAIKALKALPGIGEWTAQYIAMRQLREPDAFPAADIGLMRALETPDGNHTDASAAGSDSFDGNGDGDAGGD